MTDETPLRVEVDELKRRLQEAQETLGAIRSGEVDAIVAEGPDGPRVYTLEGAGHSYRVLVEAMSEGAATLADDGTILYGNARFAELLGAPLRRVMGSSIHDWVPADARFAFSALLRRGTEGNATEECHFRTAANEEVPVHVSVSPVEDGGQRILCLLATDLRRQKQESDAIVSAMNDALLVFDVEGNVVRANPAASRVFGFDLASIDRKELDRRAHLESPDGVKLRREEYPSMRALSGESVVALALVIPLGARRLQFEVSCSPLRSEGAITGAVSIWHDVTAIEEAKAHVEEADRRKDHFLAILSHELRNPLTPIRNSLYILDRAASGGAQARSAREVIERQTEQLTRLVDDLLDVTRIARGKIQLQLVRVELHDLVKRTMEDHFSLFESSGLTLELDAAPGDLFVRADPNRIAQVLGNLLQNAVKFTPRGGRVAVALSQDAAKSVAVLRVMDTGAGMEPAMQEKLFEPFAQADATLDRSQGGLGLGLALARGLVEQHGGSISAKSEGPGRGSEFTVRLPLGADTLGTAAAPQAPGRFARRRILVIDDNTDVARSFQEVLQMSGHDVAVAFDGPGGIAKARECRPEVVLCDIGLPGMSGYEVARAIRADRVLEGTVLVAVSGYALPEDLQLAAEAGFEKHLPKPPDLRKLEALLADLPAPR